MKRCRPVIPEEEMEEEAIGDDDAEVTVNKVEEEMIVCILTKGALICVMQFARFVISKTAETLKQRCK